MQDALIAGVRSTRAAPLTSDRRAAEAAAIAVKDFILENEEAL